MNRNVVVFGLFLLIVVAFLVGIAIGAGIIEGVTGQVVSVGDSYSWTKALCNSGSECVDVVISCSNGDVEGIDFIGEVKDYSDLPDWTDPRGEDFDKLCE